MFINTRKIMKSIKSKILAYVLPFTLIAIIGIIVIFYIFVQSTIVENTYGELNANAHRYSNQIQGWFAEKAGAINAVAKTLETDEIKKEAIYSYFRLASPQFTDDAATELYMGTKDGEFIHIMDWESDGTYDPRQRPWYIQASQTTGTVFTEPYFDVQTGQMVVSAAARINSSAGDVYGVVATDLYLGAISDLVRSIQIGKSGYVFVIDNKTGMIVMHSDLEIVGQNIVDVHPEFEKILDNVANELILNESYKTDEGKYWTSYSEIELTDWTLFIAKSEKEAMEPVRGLMYIVIILLVIAIIILTVVLLYSISIITNPIKVLLKEIAQIGSGDFSHQISDKLIAKKDEIGTFAKTVENMRVDIRGIIESIIDTSTVNDENISNIFEKIDELNIHIQEVSRTTHDLSANVEEMAASTEETSKNAGVIESTVEEISKKSYESLDNMEIIKKRASNVMKHSKEAQDRANITREEVEVKLQNAIEQSKAIDQITVLSNTIMQITGQTNLLALNASIEAARAGEHGKGFAVVADEISKLSDNSQEAVLQIQDVIVLLQNAVGELVSSSKVMVDFFENQVIGDYDGMVKTGEQYYNDSDEVSGVFNNFNSNTDELSKSIKIMSNVLSEISLTSQVSAKDNQAIADKAVLLLDNSNDIIKIVKETKEKSMQLINVVEKFKI